ncbi:hypothetical protein KL910_003935 [Ogataea haglerorum]|nr:hypothetical protein KL910_003935 [Ogataea haglerorum]
MLHCVKQYLLLHGRHRICFQGAEIIVWTDDNVVATQLCSIGSTNLRNAASKANSRPVVCKLCSMAEAIPFILPSGTT